jgi:hypothetical protein
MRDCVRPPAIHSVVGTLGNKGKGATTMGFAKPDLVLVVDGFNLHGDEYPEKFVSFDPEIVDLPTYLAGATEYFEMMAAARC